MICQNQWKTMFIALDELAVPAKQVHSFSLLARKCLIVIDLFLGYALSLVTRENWSSAGRLIKILEEAAQVFLLQLISQ